MSRLELAGEELELEAYHLFHAVRADLLARLGRGAEADAAYAAALDRTGDPLEQDLLRRRRAEAGR